MPWISRTFFLLVAAIAIAGLVSGTACTRRGKTSPIPPTSSPLTSIEVNPKTGSDTTGNGTSAKPYKTLTKAIDVVKKSATTGLTIALDAGDYNAKSGEIFPIVVPTGVTISGSNYGGGTAKGSFIDGLGEDTAYEKLANKPAQTVYTTLEIPVAATAVAANGIYVGSSRISAVLPAAAAYASVDVLGQFSPASSSFAAGTTSTDPRISGVLVASGSFSCSGCTIAGNGHAIGALSLPVASAPPPTVVLNGTFGQSKINGRDGIVTDGTASVTSSNQIFQSREYAFSDTFASPAPSAAPGFVDFGYGAGGSGGANILVGATKTEINVTLSGTQVTALGNTWNVSTQHSNPSGQYQVQRTFNPGAHGRNLTILSGLTNAFVQVGPVPVTPPPTTSPSTSPSTSPTASPT